MYSDRFAQPHHAMPCIAKNAAALFSGHLPKHDTKQRTVPVSQSSQSDDVAFPLMVSCLST